MAVLKYTGPWDERELWGVMFRKGATIQIDNADLIKKALALDGFELVEGAQEKPLPALNPDPTDYPADPSPEPEAFDDLKIPQVGAGTIPENWRTMHHSSRMKLARELSGMDDISTDAAAIATIEALLEPK